MKPLTKCLQTAVVEHKDWKLELQRFLLNYRATPHCTTKVATARHSTVRTKHTHQVTREVFESKHGRDRQEDQRS